MPYWKQRTACTLPGMPLFVVGVLVRCTKPLLQPQVRVVLTLSCE